MWGILNTKSNEPLYTDNHLRIRVTEVHFLISDYVPMLQKVSITKIFRYISFLLIPFGKKLVSTKNG